MAELFWLRMIDSSGFSVSANIEITNNVVTNTQGFVSAFISIPMSLQSHNTFWGANAYGVQVRSNQVTGRPGTYPYPLNQGFGSWVDYQNSSAPYVEKGTSALIGNVFQNNTCTNCTPYDFVLTTGDLYTVLWHNSFVNSPGISPIAVKDQTISGTTTVKSVGTVVGP